jgi:hypothetical protein
MENNTTMLENLWQQPMGWYKVIPYWREPRGNLKCMGIQAPLCINDVSGITIIHIKENLPYQNIIELNVNLRNIFGPATLVLALDRNIEFYRIEKCTNDEVKNFQILGNPIITDFKETDNGYSDIDKIGRHETKEPRRSVDTRSKSGVRRGGSRSDRKT